jgi:hypothetical protein
MARLRREVDTVKTQMQRAEEQHGREMMTRMAEHHQEVETLNGRIQRRDHTVAGLRQRLQAKEHEQEGIKAIYGQLVAQRLQGAQQMMEQAVAKTLSLAPDLPHEARLHLQVAQSVLDLAAIGNAPNAPLPVSVVQIQAPAQQPQAQQNDPQQQPVPERPGSPCYSTTPGSIRLDGL